LASIVKDPDGKKRLLFMGGDGVRRTIRLGKCEMRHAEMVRTKVEAIISAKITGVLDAETSRWLAGQEAKMYDRLARAGLAPPREQVLPTVGRLMDAFFETLAVKPATRLRYGQARKSLEEHFGATRLLSNVTPLEADRWRAAMKESRLSEATVSRNVIVARQVFKQAVRWEMLATNPVRDTKTGSQVNRARMYFVTLADAAAILKACPDAEWKLLFGLSRFGGLRCPSEHLMLRWSDVFWDQDRIRVWSPKTEHHKGREYRFIPIFPELKPLLLAVFEAAAPGTGWVITRYRQKNCNLRTQFKRIMDRAGVRPWPRTFQNLRSSRQTELSESHPAHVVCSWLGNSQVVAQTHYLQLRDSDFARAAAEPTALPLRRGSESGAHAAQIAAQHPADGGRNESQMIKKTA
jgi:integrase